MAMIRRRLPFSFPLLLLLFQFVQFHSLPFALAFHPNDTHILQGVLKEISQRQNWDFERITTSKLQVSKVRFGTAQRYEFQIRIGKNDLVLKFPDEVGSWNKFNKKRNDFGNFVREIGSSAVLDTFKVEGPFDLRVGDQDDLSLLLPLNVSHSGLKRILVGEGVTVEVKGAQELSLFHTFDHSFIVNGSFKISKGKTGFCSFWQSLCMPLLPIHVIGSASLIAYRTRNYDAPVKTTLLSEGTIELLPAKCYSNNVYKNNARLHHSLSLKINMLGKSLRSFLGNIMRQNWVSGSLRANAKASTIICFQLEIEKNVGRDETFDDVLEDWRTKPTVERVWFEVMARIEAEKLRVLMVKKVRPFVALDSVSWSNLMYNISFTKFPSILVPPESLTLDVKW
ncbi:hypothetical protein P3X46_002228 [Hevea brasiliensis]|uniref:Uncharacterized protein n=1 Tax=Hevea brasiliensis TaxID=3981 RepID=A0ABQ9N5T2_HEVBR|nr:protein TUNICAMYCIN INDUCED 1 isoform X1 [Hevea brasiliensis]KAJ9186683.1 hypothetical protein P3X46_002228 [Hevea brasiliensis]